MVFFILISVIRLQELLQMAKDRYKRRHNLKNKKWVMQDKCVIITKNQVYTLIITGLSTDPACSQFYSIPTGCFDPVLVYFYIAVGSLEQINLSAG